MVRVAIFGASGYTGLETIRLLALHTDAKITLLGSESNAGVKVTDKFPHLSKLIGDLTFSELSTEALLKKKCDLLFCALPHGVSMKTMTSLLETGVRVIDLSADFRISDPEIFEEWYKTPHLNPGLLSSAVYGSPETNREKIKKAKLIANPGCYPTSILLALFPLLKKNLVIKSSIIADSKSGVSGAGKTLKEANIFSECDEDFKAYSPIDHRHKPEIEQELSNACGAKITMTFTPHLVPMKRGIFSTIYVTPSDGVTSVEIDNAFKEIYKNEPFIRYMGNRQVPRTRDVIGTNYCDIAFAFDDRTGRLTLFSVIDNLVKGAAGQAIQNMNIMFNLPEESGLKFGAMVP